jgi:hypothetical protein
VGCDSANEVDGREFFRFGVVELIGRQPSTARVAACGLPNRGPRHVFAVLVTGCQDIAVRGQTTKLQLGFVEC